jgi:nucleoside-diphosphate-sugar epimerase
MRKILILGGTRFFGLELLRLLLEQGDQVTVASRNFLRLPKEFNITQFPFDRESPDSFSLLRKLGDFDVVYDQLCYTPNDAKLLLEMLAPIAGKLIVTSTQSVYFKNGLQCEEDFDASSYPIQFGSRKDFGYGEGKRLAEAVLQQTSHVPLVLVRLPLVLGENDYTGRLDYHIQSVLRARKIVALNPDSRTSIIHSTDAAKMLQNLGKNSLTGVFNGASLGEISLTQILNVVSAFAGKKAHVVPEGTESDKSPYAQEESRWLDTSKASNSGVIFSLINEWLPQLVESRIRLISSLE